MLDHIFGYSYSREGCQASDGCSRLCFNICKSDKLDIQKETSGHSCHMATDTDILSQILLFSEP